MKNLLKTLVVLTMVVGVSAPAFAAKGNKSKAKQEAAAKAAAAAADADDYANCDPSGDSSVSGNQQKGLEGTGTTPPGNNTGTTSNSAK